MCSTQDAPAANEWWSWRKIAENAPTLGVPHFQRGHVWQVSNMVALLESMAEGSPCGSLVLWRAPPGDDQQQYGEALVNVKPDHVQFWLVDGQQRVRSLLAIIADAGGEPARGPHPDHFWTRGWELCPTLEGIVPTEEPPGAEAGTEAEVESEDKTWFVSLPRLLGSTSTTDPSLPGWMAKERGYQSKFSPFRRLARQGPSRKEGRDLPPSARPAGLLPLVAAITASEADWKALAQSGQVASSAELIQLGRPWAYRFLTGYGDLGPESLNAEAERVIVESWRGFCQWLASSQAAAVIAKLARMARGPLFALGRLPDGTTFDEAVAAYVRINRAGVRVRAEERAFAELTRRVRQTPNALQKFAEERGRRMWSTPKEDEVSRARDRRWLAHAAERSFGFALWMRSAVRILTRHYAPGSATQAGWLGADSIERSTLQDQLNKGKDEETLARTPELASQVLLKLDDLLANQLGLDNPMGLPDARCLVPILDLLIRFPKLRDPPEAIADRRDFVLKHALLWLLLHPYLDIEKLEALLVAIHRPGADAASALEHLVHAIHGVFDGAATSSALGLREAVQAIGNEASKAVWKQLGQARSLQHRMVGLLYGLERRGRFGGGNSAMEFKWEQRAFEKKRKGVPEQRKELPLQARWTEPPSDQPEVAAIDLALERQHVIPFSMARLIVGSSRRARTGSSDANAPGNVTWLTRRQNHYDRGLGADMADLRCEPATNLHARGLGGEALDAYIQIYVRWADDPKQWKPTKNDVNDFDVFLKARHQWIADGFNNWLLEAVQDDRWARSLAEIRSWTTPGVVGRE